MEYLVTGRKVRTDSKVRLHQSLCSTSQELSFSSTYRENAACHTPRYFGKSCLDVQVWYTKISYSKLFLPSIHRNAHFLLSNRLKPVACE